MTNQEIQSKLEDILRQLDKFKNVQMPTYVGTKVANTIYELELAVKFLKIEN